jgi:hypothetical protein
MKPTYPFFALLLLPALARAQKAVPPMFVKKTLIDSVALHPHIVDVDKDGLNDIVVVNNYLDLKNKDNDANVKHLVWLQAPNWTKHSIANLPVRNCGMSTIDIDGDGWEDVVGTQDSDNNDANPGGGVFWAKNPGIRPGSDAKKGWKVTLVGDAPYAKDMLTADFDRDGRMDILSRTVSDDIHFFFQDANNQWTKRVYKTPPFDGTALADLDRDGDMDIVCNGYWLENTGKPRTDVWPQHDYAKDWYTMKTKKGEAWQENNTRLVVGDIDKDGITDVVIACGEDEGFPIEWFKGPADVKNGTWVRKTIGTLDFCHTLRLGDFDNDGDTDVLGAQFIFWKEKTPDTNPHPMVLFKNSGNGAKWTPTTIDTKGMYSGWVGDLDNDGDLDVVGPRNYTLPPLSIYENKTSDTKLALDKWTYIEVDNTRQKWGDFQAPDWLRYFGQDMADINADGFADIVAGRYVYVNPGGDMTGKWRRTDLGLNVDGMLFVNADDDNLPDIIATALPDVYWLEATDANMTSWKATKIGTMPPNDHVNGQGYRYVQLIPGGKPEILLNTGDGVYLFQIPDKIIDGQPWPKTRLATDVVEEGIGLGDIDNDGDMDLLSSKNNGTDPKSLMWYENPGLGKELTTPWKEHLIGTGQSWPDRIEVGDFNNDGLLDVALTEERYPGLEPIANLFVFYQRLEFDLRLWLRETVVTQYSMNNLDMADIDHDGDLDLITNEHKGPTLETQIWENLGHTLPLGWKGKAPAKFRKISVDKGKENHLGTRLFDMDGDGDLDVVGIAFDNHKYLHLWRNDAIKNGKPQATR